MKVLVVNAYVRENGGDAALLSVLLHQLARAYPTAVLSIAGMEDPVLRPFFESIPNIGSVRRYTSIESLSAARRVARKLLSVVIGELWFIGPRSLWIRLEVFLPKEVRAEIVAIRSANAIVALGGGYLNGKNNLGGNLNVYYLLLPVRLAQRLGKPVIFAPQSYGPFGNTWQIKKVQKTLNKAALIMVREQTSIDLLVRLGIQQSLLYKTVDSGFAFTTPPISDIRPKFGIPKSTKIVGVTARQWLPYKQQMVYERALAATIDHIQSHHKMKVVLIPQVTSAFQADDDRIVERRIADYCDQTNQPVVIDRAINHHTLKALYGQLDYLIGTRFHSVIFGLTSGVPAIAIEYEHKTGGIMRDLGLDEWVRTINKVTADDLIQTFDKLVARRDDYAYHIATCVPAYIKKTDETPKLITNVLGNCADNPATQSQAQ